MAGLSPAFVLSGNTIMLIFLYILFSIVIYIVCAGATYGYGKYRWSSSLKDIYRTDDSDRRTAAAFFWPFYWMFIWPFIKTKDVTFSYVEKSASLHIAKNKIRIADLNATRKYVIASNAELEQAELELEKEIAKEKDMKYELHYYLRGASEW